MSTYIIDIIKFISGKTRIDQGRAVSVTDELVCNAEFYIQRKDSVRGFVNDVHDGSLREVV